MRIKRKSIFDERHALARYLMPLCRTYRKLILGCAGVCLLAISVCVGWVFNQARITLAQQRARVAAQEFIPFQQVTRRPLGRPEIKFWQNVEDIRSVVS